MASRQILALALSCATASVALAKDLCIQLNSGSFAGSHLVVKKAKLGKSAAGPVEGYLARYVGSPDFFFSPIYGATIINAAGNIGVGVEVANVNIVGSGGSGSSSGSPTVITLNCRAGSDGKLGVLDPCDGLAPNASTGHIIPCAEAMQIP
jgi:hypothetical protein